MYRIERRVYQNGEPQFKLYKEEPTQEDAFSFAEEIAIDAVDEFRIIDPQGIEIAHYYSMEDGAPVIDTINDDPLNVFEALLEGYTHLPDEFWARACRAWLEAHGDE